MIKQILNTFLTKILSGVLNLVIAIVISNYLGAEGKGVQGLIITTISVLVIFAGIVGSGGITYLLPRMHFALLIIPAYLWALIISGLMWLLLSYTNIVSEEYILHIIIITFLASLSEINGAVLHANKLIQKVNLVSIVQIFTTLTVLVYLVVIKKHLYVESYIYSLYAGFILSTLSGYILTGKYYRNTSYLMPVYKYWVGVKNHIKYGGYNQLDILAQVLSFRMAYYFLNNYSSTADVGIYSNAVSIIESVWLISRSFSFVQHSRIVNSRDQNYTSSLTITFTKLSGMFALGAILVLVFIPSGFFQFVFGQEFAPMKTAILSLSPGILFFSISFIISSYFSGTGRHYINTISSVAGLIVIIVSSVILIPRFGIIGAGISASISYFITTVIKLIGFCKINKIKLIQLVPSVSDFRELKTIFKS